MHMKKWMACALIAIALPMSLTGCKNKAEFRLWFPGEDVLQLEVELGKKIGLELDQEVDVLGYGTVYVKPETSENNAMFGFQLKTDVFLDKVWDGYSKVNTLPTGAAFPDFMTTSVVDVVIPPINTKEINWHFYFGTEGEFYVGTAAVISRVNEKFPQIDLRYNFRDKEGRVILGVVFFGPKVSEDGELEVPGGIFIGSNLTPFLPEGWNPEDGDPEEFLAQAMHDVAGKAVSTEVVVTERGMSTAAKKTRKYSQAEIQQLARRFLKTTQK